MRETRIARLGIFDLYSKHEIGVRLKQLSSILDQHPELLAH
ncbi:MAG: IS5 family transposase [Candidatus Azotimanducaceae bacterium]|jgi:IS5 family transposase